MISQEIKDIVYISLFSGILLFIVQRIIHFYTNNITKLQQGNSLNGHLITYGDFKKLLEEKLENINEKIDKIEGNIENIKERLSKIEYDIQHCQRVFKNSNTKQETKTKINDTTSQNFQK